MMTKQPDTAVWICSLQHSGALPLPCSIVLSDVLEAACFPPPLYCLCSPLYCLYHQFLLAFCFLQNTVLSWAISFFLFFFFLNYESQQLVTCLWHQGPDWAAACSQGGYCLTVWARSPVSQGRGQEEGPPGLGSLLVRMQLKDTQ